MGRRVLTVYEPKTLEKLLKNRAYVGEYTYGELVIEDGIPRLVDDLTFEEVQRRFAPQQAARSEDPLTLGKLPCDK